MTDAARWALAALNATHVQKPTRQPKEMLMKPMQDLDADKRGRTSNRQGVAGDEVSSFPHAPCDRSNARPVTVVVRRRRLSVSVAAMLLLALPTCGVYQPPRPRGIHLNKAGFYFVARMEEHQYVWTEVGDVHEDRESAESEMKTWLRTQEATALFACVYPWNPVPPVGRQAAR